MSVAAEGVRIITTGFIYPPFAANQNPGTPCFQQPCTAAAGSSSSPVLGPTMVVMHSGAGEIIAIEDEYIVMSQAGTLTSQNTSMIVAQQGQSSSDAGGNVALPMYSIVNKGEPSDKPSKLKVMVTE